MSVTTVSFFIGKGEAGASSSIHLMRHCSLEGLRQSFSKTFIRRFVRQVLIDCSVNPIVRLLLSCTITFGDRVLIKVASRSLTMSTSETESKQVSNNNNLSEPTEENIMPGNSRSPRRSVCPTVSFIDQFPQNGDVFKANFENNGSYQGLKSCQPLNSESLHTGRYLELTRYSFQDSAGNTRTAEGVHMVKNVVDQKPQKKGIPTKIPTKLGNLCTIAVLKKQIMCDSLVLTKQYRAPLQKYTIEFPASVSMQHFYIQNLKLIFIIFPGSRKRSFESSRLGCERDRVGHRILLFDHSTHLSSDFLGAWHFRWKTAVCFLDHRRRRSHATSSMQQQQSDSRVSRRHRRSASSPDHRTPGSSWEVSRRRLRHRLPSLRLRYWIAKRSSSNESWGCHWNWVSVVKTFRYPWWCLAVFTCLLHTSLVRLLKVWNSFVEHMIDRWFLVFELQYTSLDQDVPRKCKTPVILCGSIESTVFDRKKVMTLLCKGRLNINKFE